MVVSDSWFAGLLRTKILARFAAFAMRRKRIQSLAFRVVSQTGINYRKSALSKSADALPRSAPQAGDRFPWLKLAFEGGGAAEDSFQRFGDLRFNLVIAGQPAAHADEFGLGDLLRIHAIASSPANDAALARAKIPQPSYYLLRPDGHVGLSGARFDDAAVKRYVTDTLGFASRSA